MGGLNPAHVPYWRENNPTLWDFCISMIGRADIEGSLLWTFGCHKPVIPPPTNLGICRPLHSAWPSKGIQCLPRNNVAHRHADLKTDASVCIQGMIGRALIGFSRFRSIFVGRTCFQWQRNLMRSIYVCLKGFSIVVSKSYCAFFTFPSLPTHRCRQPLQLLSSGWKTTFCPLHREGCWTAVPQRAKPASICAPATPLLRAFADESMWTNSSTDTRFSGTGSGTAGSANCWLAWSISSTAAWSGTSGKESGFESEEEDEEVLELDESLLPSDSTFCTSSFQEPSIASVKPSQLVSLQSKNRRRLNTWHPALASQGQQQAWSCTAILDAACACWQCKFTGNTNPVSQQDPAVTCREWAEACIVVIIGQVLQLLLQHADLSSARHEWNLLGHEERRFQLLPYTPENFWELVGQHCHKLTEHGDLGSSHPSTVS